MDRDAFISGFLAERRLYKEAYQGRTPQPPVKPAAPPESTTADGGGIPSIDQPNSPTTKQRTPARETNYQNLRGQQLIAEEEGNNTPGILHTMAHQTISGDNSLSNYLPGSRSLWIQQAKKQLGQQINGINPGESVLPKAMSGSEMLNQDTVLQRPELMDHAKQLAVNKSQQIAKATPLNELSQMQTSQVGGNTPLANALKQHVGNDPRNLEALTKIVGNKPGVYGMAGVGPGLKAKFTPQNFQFGQFANDHWGKILAGLAALLMGGHMASRMGSQQQRPAEVWD